MCFLGCKVQYESCKNDNMGLNYKFFRKFSQTEQVMSGIFEIFRFKSNQTINLHLQGVIIVQHFMSKPS